MPNICLTLPSMHILHASPARTFRPDVTLTQNIKIFGRPDLQYNVLYEPWRYPGLTHVRLELLGEMNMMIALL